MKFLLLPIVLGMAACGCGVRRDPPAVVEGRIVNAGRPVTDAVVYFENEASDHSLYVRVGPDGEFKVKTFDYGGIPAGTYRIAIKPDVRQGVHLVGDDKTTLSHPLIPDYAMKSEPSGLRVEVKQGENPAIFWDLAKK